MLGAIKKHKKIILFLCSACLLIIYLTAQNNWIKVEHIEVAGDIPAAFDGLKIIHISDTHLPKNASSIAGIIELVRRQNPDIIVLTGDLIDSTADMETCGLVELCAGLSDICAVYAVGGNHEIWNGNTALWEDILLRNGVTPVEGRYATLERASRKIAVMGLPDGKSYSPGAVEGIEDISGLYKILLAHRPELFSSYCSDSYPIRPDLIFSGHAHGGQFRIPFGGGVIAPDQGFFPQYISGFYFSGNGAAMVVSRGLGNSVIPFRINNRPHLPVITLKSTE